MTTAPARARPTPLARLAVYRTALGRDALATALALALAPLLSFGLGVAVLDRLAATGLIVLGACSAAALAAALYVAQRQAGAALRIIDALQAALRKLGRERPTLASALAGRDEYAQLLDTFNEVARDLSLRLALQAMVAQLDQTLLVKADMRTLVGAVLQCLEQVTLAQVVVVGIFDNESAGEVQLYFKRKGERDRIEALRLPLSDELKRQIPLKPGFKTAPESPLPLAVRAKLQLENGISHYFTVPAAHAGHSAGFLLAGYCDPAVLNAGQSKLIAHLSARLISGLHSIESEQRLRTLAYVDRLTGLPNRDALVSMLEQELEAVPADQGTVAVLYIDLDRFRQINEAFSRGVGDRLLVEVTRRLQEEMSASTIVARVGGDEFVVVLTRVKSRRDSALCARKLISALSRAFDVGGRKIFTGASIGIASGLDNHAPDADLLKMAEAAVHRAKKSGRNRLAFFDQSMSSISARRSRLDIELRSALRNNELTLHYQPQIDLANGALHAVEALVRWHHPQRGLLFPVDFIADAEDIGLIPEIGHWVMRSACAQLAQWRAAGVQVPRIAVNVSNGQLPRSGFVAAIRQALESSGLPADCLEIEVTESMIASGGAAAMEAIRQLAGDGIQIAIDDFGTGYSSFSYLRTMPAQVLKLDMSFVVDLKRDNDASKVVAAITNMAHALGKQVVAEGVERPEQLLLLKTLGCDRGQGYLLGKPADAAYIERKFAAGRDYSQPLPSLQHYKASTAGAVSQAPTAAAGGETDSAQATAPVKDWDPDPLSVLLTVPRLHDDGTATDGVG